FNKEEDEKNLLCPADEVKGETKTQTSAEQATIVNSKDKKGCTPLMRAAENGNLQAVRELLKAGADVNDKLGHLSSDGSTSSTRKDTRLWPGISALMLAAKKGQLEIVKVLLAAGADPNGKLVSFQFGFETPLMFAIDPCTKNRFAIMDSLIAGGAEVNPTTGGAPPLTYAISKHDTIMINALIARGADINLADANGTTPLMYAVLGSDPRMVRFLLAAGADVSARNLKGEDALAIVSRLKKDFPNSEQDEIIRLLKNATRSRAKRNAKLH
ncbi:MAG: ankyrin repeat domain-containing protein, partial [Pyrinomonadaceae bacterium]